MSLFIEGSSTTFGYPYDGIISVTALILVLIVLYVIYMRVES